MRKYNSPSPLDGVTFEEIMSEPEVPSNGIRRNSRLPGEDSSSRKARHANSSPEFSIIKNYGKLSKKKSAATFALVDWNGYKRYDLRSWSEDYSTPFKGLSFTEEEISTLSDVLTTYTFQTYSTPKYVCDMGKTNAKIYCSVCKLSSATVRGVTWNKQVSIGDWGYGQKYDLRKWTDGYDKCSKGICLSKDEVEALVSILETLHL